MGKIKSPKELFELKRLQSLEELQRKKQIENEQKLQKELSRKVLSPKLFFRDTEVVITEEVKEENEPYIEEVVEEKVDVEKLIIDLFELVDNLKEDLNNTKKYSKEINFIKKYVKNLEKDIYKKEDFDAYNISENILLLKESIEKVRSEIPSVPEPILYDEQLEDLRKSIFEIRESIPIVPEIKYYDSELDELINNIESVKEQIKNFPEVKYYDYQISLIEEKLITIKNSIPEIPEIKYYDEDIDYLEEKINEVKFSIPIVPEIRYYDDQIDKIESEINNIKNLIDIIPEIKYYDNDISVLTENLLEIKNTVSELPEPKYYENELESLNEKIESIRKSIPEQQIIPEIKYYDDEINSLKKDISFLFEKVTSIKIPDDKKNNEKLESFYAHFLKQNEILSNKVKDLEKLFEGIVQTQDDNLILEEDIEISEKPDSDPLTPLTQNFVTFKQLQEHYRLFINRIQQQLATIGGGGETQLKYLDDIVGIATNASAYDGKYLKYNHSIRKFEFTTVVGEDGAFSGTLKNLFDVDNSNLSDGSIMVYNQTIDKFVFVSPQSYFGINSDYNPDPLVDDYGTYN